MHLWLHFEEMPEQLGHPRLAIRLCDSDLVYAPDHPFCSAQLDSKLTMQFRQLYGRPNLPALLGDRPHATRRVFHCSYMAQRRARPSTHVPELRSRPVRVGGC